MKRLFTATCLAATFAVGLAAQSTGTAGTATGQDPQTPGAQRGAGARTVTGCLRAGDTAETYTLTDVVMPGGAPRGGDPTSTGGSTTPPATPEAGRPMPPASIMLNAASDIDLKAHVGHKVEVTGTMAGARARGGDAAGSATGTATGTTGAGTTATGSATGTATGAGASATSGAQATGRGGRSMTVTSVRMVSESCS